MRQVASRSVVQSHPGSKGYPFEVPVTPANGVRGVVLCDQVRNVDWRARNARLIIRASPECVDDVLAKIEALLSR